MNTQLEGTYVATVALRGRVPCKVVGIVKKGDILISSDTAGHAVAAKDPYFVNGSMIVGIALEDKKSVEPGFVEIII